jgi:murein DD-endopeptidase MepM/ murein hydrolase activator NlpD
VTVRGVTLVAMTTALVLAALAATADASRRDAASSRSHHVETGDTLSGIAQRYGVTVPSIVRANRFKSSSVRLKVGSRLAIPAASRGEGPAVRPAAARASTPRVRSATARGVTAVAPAKVARVPATRSARVRRAALRASVPMPLNMALDIPDFVAIAPAFQWPVEGIVSSTFGRRRRAWHRGLDIMAPPGTAVLAAAPGLVVASGWEDRYGRVVKIAHEDGFLTVYAHNRENMVDVGDWVMPGQTIATVGRTGRATSEHVHFEVRHEGRTYNPVYLLPEPPRIVQVQDIDSPEDIEDE